MRIGKHSVVSIDYTLTDADGAVIDSSKGQEPLAYIHGTGSIVVGLEEALEGKEKGATLKVSIPPAKGYGERDPKLAQKVPRAMFDVKELQRSGCSRVARAVNWPVMGYWYSMVLR